MSINSSQSSWKERLAKWRPPAMQTYAALAVSLTCGQGMTAVSIGSIMIYQLHNQEHPDPFYSQPLVNDIRNNNSLTPLASLYFAGIMVGALGASWLGHRYGARRVTLASTVVAAGGWSLLAAAPNLSVALTARTILGVYFGAAFPSNNLFISGTAAPRRRGLLSYSLEVANVLFGVLSFSLAGQLHWRQLALLLGVGNSFMTWAALVWLRDDPVWLVAQNRPTEAQQSLAFYRGVGNDLWLLQKPKKQLPVYTATKDCWYQHQKKKISLFKWWHLRPLKLCSLQVVMYVCSGGAVLQYYTAIFIGEMMKHSDNDNEEGEGSGTGVIGVHLLSALLTITRVPAAVLSACMVDKYGRRQILQLSSFGMALCHALLLFHTLACQQDSASPSEGWWSGLYQLLTNQWLGAGALIVWMAAFTLGNGPLTWTLVGEMLPTSVHHVYASLLIVFWASITLLHVQTYQALKGAIGQHGVFVLWTLISLAHIGFVRLWLPETKGLTHWQVDKLFEPKPVMTTAASAGDEASNSAVQTNSPLEQIEMDTV